VVDAAGGVHRPRLGVAPERRAGPRLARDVSQRHALHRTREREAVLRSVCRREPGSDRPTVVTGRGLHLQFVPLPRVADTHEPGAIATVEALQDALAAWVIIPEALRQRLAWDQAAEQMLTVGDPQAYRWFLVSGQLVADGRTIPILTGAHAADLPAGDAGRAEVAERMRRTVAAGSGDPTARWQDLQVIELPIDAKQAPNLA